MIKLLQKKYLMTFKLYSRSLASILLVIFVTEILCGVGLNVPFFHPKALEAAVNTGSAIPAVPQANAAGMNMNAFGGANSGVVDMASGAFDYKKTDLSLPGRNGMGITVERTYNSKEFKASPKWSKLDGEAYTSYSGQDVKYIKWQAATPAQWGGWIGNGWKTNISGRLLHIRFDSYQRKSDWWGSNLVFRDQTTTDIVIIQTGEGSYSFEREVKKNKDGVAYEDKAFVSRDKGNMAKLTQSVGGYVLTLQNGKQLVFRENYYNKSYHIDYYRETSYRSVHEEWRVDNVVVGDYVSYVEDTNGNRISIEYERGTPFVYPELKESLDSNPFTQAYGGCIQGVKDEYQRRYYRMTDTMGQEAANHVLRTVADTANQMGFGTAADSLKGALSKLDVMNITVGSALGMEALYNETSEVASEVTETVKQAQELWNNPGKALQKMLQDQLNAMLNKFIQEQLEKLQQWLMEQLAMMVPVLGQIVAIIKFLKWLADLFLGDVARGEWRANQDVTPMRPVRIYDNAGNEVKINYIEPQLLPIKTVQDITTNSDNDSRIASLEYKGPKGLQKVEYVYDKNGYLIQVKKPGNDIEYYNYTYYHPLPKNGAKVVTPEGLPIKTFSFDYEKAKALSYDHTGALLSYVRGSSGWELALEYDFVHSKVLREDVTEDEDGRFSSFVITKRKVSGKAAQGELSSVWQYSGYDKVGVYTVLKRHPQTGDKANRSVYFSKITLTDPKGNEQVSTFVDGMPEQVRNAMGHVTFYSFDKDSRRPLREEINTNGFLKVKQYKNYDEFGFPQVIEAYGTDTPARVQHTEYDRSSVLLEKHILNKPKKSWVESEGKRFNETEYRYDDKGQCVEQRLSTPAGPAITRVQYDGYGNVIEVSQPNGAVVESRYENGIVSVQTLFKPLNWEERQTYYANSGLIKEKTDINGNTTRYDYDDRGRVISEVKTVGSSVFENQFSYTDTPGDLRQTLRTSSSQGRQNKTIEGRFNAFGKPDEVTVYPKGLEPQTTRYGYDNSLTIVWQTDAAGRTSRYSYDGIDRLTEVTAADGQKVSLSYNDSGNEKAITDENGHVTKYGYNSQEELVYVRLPNFAVTRYVRDGLGNVVEAYDMRNIKTGYQYDPNGRLLETQYANGSKERLSYDAAGRLISVTTAKGDVVSYEGYDSKDRVKGVSYSDGTVLSYTYDEGFKGVLSKIEVRGKLPQTLSYTYNGLGQLVEEKKQYGNRGITITREYDDTGLLLKEKDSLSNQWQDNAYDGMGRLQSIRYPINGQVKTIVGDITYSKGQQLQHYSLPEAKLVQRYEINGQNDRVMGIEVTGPSYMTYDRWNEADVVRQLNVFKLKQYEKSPVVEGQGVTYFKEKYRYDAAGNRIERQHEGGEANFGFKYRYDANDQLLGYSVKHSVMGEYAEQYRYDVGGNRVSLESEPKGVGYSYTAANELTHQKVTEKVIAPNGNPGTVTYEWQYGYDANSNRTEAKAQRDGVVLDRFGYTWDAQNRLIELTQNGVPIQKNSYELNGYRVEKHDVQDKTTTQYTVDSALKVLSETRTAPQQTQTYRYLYMGNQRIARVETDAKTQKDRVLYYHNDPMGTPIMMTIQDTASTQNYYAVSHQAMDPWGVELRAGYFTGTNDVVYTQKTLDQSTGLYDFGYRFYDRDAAQFLGQDLVPPQYETPLTLNTFQFCLNNPNVYVDPDGRSPIVIVGIGALVNVGLDYYSQYKQSGMSFKNFYLSGQYSPGRAVGEMALGGATTAIGGVAGAAKIGLAAKSLVFAGTGMANTYLNNKLTGESNSLAVGGLTGVIGFGLGRPFEFGLEKALSSFGISKYTTTSLGETLKYGMDGYTFGMSKAYSTGTILGNTSVDLSTNLFSDYLNNSLFNSKSFPSLR